jgi:hypothetical protein
MVTTRRSRHEEENDNGPHLDSKQHATSGSDSDDDAPEEVSLATSRSVCISSFGCTQCIRSVRVSPHSSPLVLSTCRESPMNYKYNVRRSRMRRT